MLDPDGAVTHPGEHAAHEAVLFGHPVDRLVDAAVDQTEVASVRRHAAVGELPEHPVEQPRVQPPERAGAVPRGDDAVDVLEPLLPLLEEERNQLRRILEVGGHDHRRVAACVRETRCDAAVRAEVTRELDDLEPLVALVQRE